MTRSRTPATLHTCALATHSPPVRRAAAVSDILTICAEITGQKESDVPVRWRDKGKFRSITLTLTFTDADMVYAVYAAVNRDPRVRFKL